MSIKFLLFFGGGGGYFGFGGECRFYFYGREDFSDKRIADKIAIRERFSITRKSRVLGPQDIARFFGESRKIAAATAEGRAILVHSAPDRELCTM